MSPFSTHFFVVVCFQDYESGIPLEYLKGLDESYSKFLDEMR